MNLLTKTQINHTNMKKDKDYNWWTDPENAEKVKEISWWEHEENKTHVNIPVSIVEGEGYWVIGSNKETEKLFGENGLPFSAQGNSRQDAIDQFFFLFRSVLEHERREVLKYKRWVPFRKGAWNHTGGKWFVVFGLHFYCRYGNGMKGGKYIPFTKLNIAFHSEWASYKKYKKEKNNHKIQ